MKKTTNGNSCLISESRHFPNNKKKLRNQRNGNKRQNNKMATNEKTERKKQQEYMAVFGRVPQ
jgi:hypothetical protein